MPDWSIPWRNTIRKNPYSNTWDANGSAISNRNCKGKVESKNET